MHAGKTPPAAYNLRVPRLFLGARPPCHECGAWATSDVHALPGEGPDIADIALIGEGPGAEEEQYAQNFIGRAGEMLNECLTQANILRSECFICNSVRCRTITPIGKNRKPKPFEVACCRSFTVDDLRRVKPKVIVALGDTPATLLLGKLLGGVTENRGKVRWSDEFNAWIIVTFHPAYALRYPAQMQFIVDDLRTAKRVSVEGYTPGEPTQIEVVTDIDRYRQVRDELLHDALTNHRTLHFDWETLGGAHLVKARGFCLSMTTRPRQAKVIPRYLQGGTMYLSKAALREMDAITSEIMTSDAAKGGSNLPFDFIISLNTLGVLPRKPKFDAQLVHHLLNVHLGERAHSLKVMAAMYTDMGRYDDVLDQWLVDNHHTLDGKPDPEFIYMAPDDLVHRYNGMDADAPCRLEEIFWPQMIEMGVLHAYENPLDGRLALAMEHAIHIDRVGVRIDREYLDTLSDTLATAVETIEQDIVQEIGPDTAAKFKDAYVNPGSAQQVARLLYDEMELPIMGRTDTGAPSTSGEILKTFEKAHKVVELILRHRTFTKIKSTWVDGGKTQRGQKKALRLALDDDGYARMSTRITGPETFRFATRRPFPIHTFPKDDRKYPSVRRLVVPDDGYRFCSRDYVQQEWAITAIAADQVDMIEAILDRGEDVHDKVARDLGGVKKSDYLALDLVRVGDTFMLPSDALARGIALPPTLVVRDELVWRSKDHYDEYKKLRSTWKSTNFAILFLGGPGTLARRALNCKCVRVGKMKINTVTNDICEHEAIAQQFINDYYERYEAIKWYQYETKKFLRQHGYVRGLFDTYRKLPGIMSTDFFTQLEAERQACNFGAQNGGAHVMVRALMRVQRAWRGDLPQRAPFPGRVVFTVHDQLVAQIRHDLIDDGDYMLQKAMEAPYPELGGRSLRTDRTISDSWGS